MASSVIHAPYNHVSVFLVNTGLAFGYYNDIFGSELKPCIVSYLSFYLRQLYWVSAGWQLQLNLWWIKLLWRVHILALRDVCLEGLHIFADILLSLHLLWSRPLQSHVIMWIAVAGTFPLKRNTLMLTSSILALREWLFFCRKNTILTLRCLRDLCSYLITLIQYCPLYTVHVSVSC